MSGKGEIKNTFTYQVFLLCCSCLVNTSHGSVGRITGLCEIGASNLPFVEEMYTCSQEILLVVL